MGVTMKPMFINSLNPISIFCCFSIPNHIRPASAPSGVRFAPKLAPTTVAYTDPMLGGLLVSCKIGTKATDIGMLFSMFAASVDRIPKMVTEICSETFVSWPIPSPIAAIKFATWVVLGWYLGGTWVVNGFVSENKPYTVCICLIYRFRQTFPAALRNH